MAHGQARGRQRAVRIPNGGIAKMEDRRRKNGTGMALA
ncbi:MAG: hypothetical protein RLZ59_1170, partial [Pseudomonadota bacterium]